MKHGITISALALLMTGLIGCGGIAGQWTLHEPDQENFPISDVTFNDDGTYTVVSAYGDQKRESEGTYTFADGKLTFTPSSGNERVYDAKLTGLGGKLRVSTKKDDEEIVATMKRSD